MAGGKLTKLLTSGVSTFVVVNILANLLFLVRSYVSMRVLEHEQLGMVALLQTLILLISTLQFGMVNGGYRLLCSEGEAQSAHINDLVFTFTGALGLCCTIALICVLPFLESSRIILAAILGVVAGVATLLRNWLANHLIAKVKLKRFNSVTVWCAVISMAPLALIPLAPLTACLASVALQPLAFVVVVLWTEPALRPHRLAWPRALVRQVMAAGFAVFLTGMLLQLNQQIERWYILKYLGLAALGHLYLMLLYVNLFQIVPTSLDSLFLPRVVRAQAQDDKTASQREIRKFLLVEAAYCAAAVFVTVLLAGPVLRLLLPRYLVDLPYVWLFLPGLVAFTLASPFALVFNVLIRYRAYYVAYGLGSLLTASVYLGYLVAGGTLDLTGVVVLKACVYALMAICLVWGWAVIARKNPAFRIRSNL